MKSNRAVGIFAATIASVALLAGCSSPAPSTGGEKGTDQSASQSGSGSAGPYTIGVSNAFVGSEYRTQMIEVIQQTFDEYKEQGLVDNLVLENADADINGQIQQIRNLINAGVDVIIVDPNSATALSAVFKEATDQGIKVYAIDQAVDSPEVINVGISQKDLGKASAEWFAAKVGDGAKIVTVEGAAGNPATEARWAGAEEVFAAHNIEVLTHGDGGWDQTTGQTVATDLLATYPDIQGIWTYDGMAQGVLRAVEAAGKIDSISVTGEARVAYLTMWQDQLANGFETVGIVNPPGTGAAALHIAMNELQGKQLNQSKLVDGHTVILPLADPVTNDNLAEIWETVKDKPETYVIDSVLSAEEVTAAYF